MTWKLAVAAALVLVGAVHAWALRHPAGKADMMLHRIWHTKCFHGGKDQP